MSEHATELAQYEDDRVWRVQQDYPQFLCAAVTALLFTFEALLDDMVERPRNGLASGRSSATENFHA